MRCPICVRDIELTPTGTFPVHRVSDRKRHRWSFCDASGEPGEIGVRAMETV